MRRPILKKIDLNCSHCNKVFQKYPSQVKSNKETVFCGNQCVIDYRKIHWNAQIERVCIRCEKIFKVFQSVLKQSKGAAAYCSKECGALHRTKILTCLRCNNQFKEYISNIERGKRFCSKKCFNDPRTPEQRFWDAIIKGKNENGCWDWSLKKDKDGYCILWIDKNIKAHRYSYELHYGKIPKGLIICHKCDNPRCTNPKHLYAGTHEDNALDRTDKTRWTDYLIV